jgi:hypothetical protein
VPTMPSPVLETVHKQERLARRLGTFGPDHMTGGCQT